MFLLSIGFLNIKAQAVPKHNKYFLCCIIFMNRYIFQLKHKEKNKMGIRLNGISTPFGGVQWEYTDEGQQYDFEKIFYLPVS